MLTAASIILTNFSALCLELKCWGYKEKLHKANSMHISKAVNPQYTKEKQIFYANVRFQNNFSLLLSKKVSWQNNNWNYPRTDITYS